MSDTTQFAGVWLVGAGPGDPDLMTRKAWKLIRAADLIIYDRLVGPGIVAEFPENAQKVYAGKSRGCHCLSQKAINRLLLSSATSGRYRLIVRLKGGDPFVFGRGGEELRHLREKGVFCDVVPAVTTATAAAAALSVPLTDRELAHSVQFLSGHLRGGGPGDLLPEGFDPGNTTYVFYMSLGRLEEIRREMEERFPGADSFPAALVERVSQPGERWLLEPGLEELIQRGRAEKFQSPSLLILGRVLGSHPDLTKTRARVRQAGWLTNTDHLSAEVTPPVSTL